MTGILERLVGTAADWVPLRLILAPYLGDAATQATVLASSFAASLELAREGRVELRQDGAFAPLLARAKQPNEPLEALRP